MEHHPYFDLWLHSTQELTARLGIEIVDRNTLHEWPLSCVQLLHLADGSQKIYKSQLRATTVEPEFYSAACKGDAQLPSGYRSCLPQSTLLETMQNSVGMVIEYINVPNLDRMQLTDTEIVEHGNRLLSAMHQFPADFPAYIDISSRAKWSAYVDETLSMLQKLIISDQFHLTTIATNQKLVEWSNSDAILAAVQAPFILNHGDLTGDNIFVTAEGYKIIDWQRPVRGPAGLDLAKYYYAMGLEPLKYIHHSLVKMNWFLHLRWFVECKLHWFPSGDTYDRQVAELVDSILNC